MEANNQDAGGFNIGPAPSGSDRYTLAEERLVRDMATVKEAASKCQLPGVVFEVEELGQRPAIKAGIPMGGDRILWARPWIIMGNASHAEVAKVLFNASRSILKKYAFQHFLFEGLPIFDEKA